MSKDVFMRTVNYQLSHQYPMVRGWKQKKSKSEHRRDVRYTTFYILQLLHFGSLRRDILQRHFGNHSKIAIASLCCQGLAIQKQGLISITESGKKITLNSQICFHQNRLNKECSLEALVRRGSLY